MGLMARVTEEILAGLNTGLLRALGSTGGVVTSAGLVFAFTMLAMLTSDLRTIGRVGTTVCIGLLLDTLIVRYFVVPVHSAHPRAVVLVADAGTCASVAALASRHQAARRELAVSNRVRSQTRKMCTPR
jgi:uncharacterized membrane protein YdfJ with MMPL/SSD domain